MASAFFEKIALVGVLLFFIPISFFVFGIALIHDAIIRIKYGPIPEKELRKLQWRGLA